MGENNEQPSVIWHYTNWSGIEGILKNQCLWASHISYLNDTYELRHAIKILRKIFSLDGKGGLVYRIHADIQSALNEFAGFDVFVSSFSRNGDDLSQWRGYADPPPGFALGFNLTRLSAIARREKCRVVACEYDKVNQRNALLSLADGFKSQFHLEVGMDNYSQRAPTLVQSIMNNFAQIAPEFKSERFSAEDEWRLITESTGWSTNLDFHVSKTLVVPHFRFLIKQDDVSALVAVRIGPNAHMKLAHKSLQMLLHARGFADVEVCRSKVPFRNW